MTSYEKITNEYGNELVLKTDKDGVISFIPIDESNSDYQRYLRWLENPDAEEGGTL